VNVFRRKTMMTKRNYLKIQGCHKNTYLPIPMKFFQVTFFLTLMNLQGLLSTAASTQYIISIYEEVSATMAGRI
jgi:hypothetical protein